MLGCSCQASEDDEYIETLDISDGRRRRKIGWTKLFIVSVSVPLKSLNRIQKSSLCAGIEHPSMKRRQVHVNSEIRGPRAKVQRAPNEKSVLERP